jgi:hypothetical protein
MREIVMREIGEDLIHNVMHSRPNPFDGWQGELHG